MKKFLSLLLVLVMCLGLMTVAWAADEPAANIESTLQPGDAVPDFTVTLDDGSVFTLSEALKTNKAVMVNIWGTWCHCCVEEMPAMQKAYANYSGDVAVICLSLYDDNEDITAFKQANDLQLLPMGYDSVGMTNAVEVDGFPTTIMIDRFGNYAFYHCGEIMDPDQFVRIWDYFASDEYTETTVLDQIPAAKYAGEYPNDESLTAALCKDGSVSFSCVQDEEDVWPFVVNENGVVNSNALQLDTTAGINAAFTAEAGDVFAIDYDASLDTIIQEMEIYVNGERETPLYYTGKGTWVYKFTEAGEVELSFTYNEACSEDATDADGTIQLSNARLLSGAEAEAAITAQPVYVTSQKGEEYDLELLSENAKEIEISGPKGAGLNEELFGSDITCYIVPDDTCTFRMLLGEGRDASHAVALGMSDCPTYYACPMLQADNQGYLFDMELSCLEDGGNSFNAVVMYPDMFDTSEESAGDMKTILLFKNEENVNAYLSMVYTDAEGNPEEGGSWAYTDGTQAASTECAQLAVEDTLLYNIYLLDENGEPVNGCMINICDDKNCCPHMLKDTAYYGFNGINDAQYTYIVHVLKVPEGYSFDTSTQFTLNEAGDTLIITIPHA